MQTKCFWSDYDLPMPATDARGHSAHAAGGDLCMDELAMGVLFDDVCTDPDDDLQWRSERTYAIGATPLRYKKMHTTWSMLNMLAPYDTMHDAVDSLVRDMLPLACYTADPMLHLQGCGRKADAYTENAALCNDDLTVPHLANGRGGGGISYVHCCSRHRQHQATGLADQQCKHYLPACVFKMDFLQRVRRRSDHSLATQARVAKSSYEGVSALTNDPSVYLGLRYSWVVILCFAVVRATLWVLWHLSPHLPTNRRA